MSDLVVPEDTIIIYAGARDLGGNLGWASAGSFNKSVFGGSAFDMALTTRGETGVGTTDFAPWGGSIAVDTLTSWDLSEDGSGTGQHLRSTLIHEVAHVLGFGTADSWHAQRTGNQFNGTAAVAENGGPVTLEAGSDHWLAGTMSEVWGTSTPQEANLDPDITAIQRKEATKLDIAALDDIGWDVNYAAIPEPTQALLLGLGSLLLLRRRRR